MQWIALFICGISRNMGAYLYYPFAILTAEQPYLCQFTANGAYESCDKDQVCEAMQPGSGVNYMLDSSNPNAWNNWYVQMDMACMNLFYVGMIYIIMRVTEGCVGIMLAGITDRIGRRKAAQIFLAVNLCAQTIIIFVPTFYGRLFGYMLYASANTKNSVAYVWIFELVEAKYKTKACTFINSVDTLTMVITASYILFVSRNWFPLEFTLLLLGVANYICLTLLMPESPKWLLMTGQVDKAIHVFNKIAEANGSINRIPENA